MAEEDPWLSLTEAAQRSGLAREAVRARARRGQITSRKGNRGELLVQLPADLLAGSGHDAAGPQADLLADILAELADLRERLARAEAEAVTAKAVAEARAEAARDTAEARVDAARAEAKAVRELADRLTAELAEVRRPWWRRLLSGLVICTLFLGSTARAGAPQDGKYACIVEKSYGIFDRNDEITSGKLKLRNEKFILSVYRNESRDDDCEKLRNLKGFEASPAGRAFALLCTSSTGVRISADDVFDGPMMGDGISFYDAGSSILSIFASEDMAGRFKFIKTLFAVFGDKATEQYTEQYTIIARCEKF